MELSNGNQINWVVESSSDASNWTEVSNNNTGSTDHGYTPVASDAARYLRFKATYKGGCDTVNARTIEAQTDNKVLAEPPSNGFQGFTESYPSTRTIAENAAGGSNVGSPVSATDPDGDTITYLYAEYYSDIFSVDPATGQIVLDEDESLDYEAKRTFHVRVIVRDSKDLFGDADVEYDVSRLVPINVTSAEEEGSVELSSDIPRVYEGMTAKLRDPDGSVTNLTWQWQIADSAESTTWTDISDATSAYYIPVVEDIGKYLGAKASYDDGKGTGEEAIGTATNAVVLLDNEAPTFDEVHKRELSCRDKSRRRRSCHRSRGRHTDLLVGVGYRFRKVLLGPCIRQVGGSTRCGAGLRDRCDAGGRTAGVRRQDARHNLDTSVDATITLTINLINVDEPGEVTLSSGEPEVGESITATLTDPDVVNSTDWHWKSRKTEPQIGKPSAGQLRQRTPRSRRTWACTSGPWWTTRTARGRVRVPMG